MGGARIMLHSYYIAKGGFFQLFIFAKNNFCKRKNGRQRSRPSNIDNYLQFLQPLVVFSLFVALEPVFFGSTCSCSMFEVLDCCFMFFVAIFFSFWACCPTSSIGKTKNFIPYIVRQNNKRFSWQTFCAILFSW